MRESHKWLIALLPVAGLVVGCAYRYLGTAVQAGNNLILDEIHDPQRTIQPPWQWAWKLVFTAVTLGAGFKDGEVTPLFYRGSVSGSLL